MAAHLLSKREGTLWENTASKGAERKNQKPNTLATFKQFYAALYTFSDFFLDLTCGRFPVQNANLKIFKFKKVLV